jgi:SAM-dependent methyltransferase
MTHVPPTFDESAGCMIEIRHKAVGNGLSVQDAYDHLFRQRKLLMRDSFYLWLLELVRPVPGEVLVDVACGNGRLVELAERREIQAIGFDLSFEGIYAAATATPGADWVVGNGQSIPFPDASADIVMSIGSLEHYDEPTQGAREIARILAPAGRACILLPNTFGLLGNIRHVHAHGEVFDDEQPLQRYATRRTWETMLARGGLEVDHLIPFGEFNRPRTVADAFWLFARPQKFIRGAMAAVTPINLANHFIFFCRRAVRPDDRHYPMLSYL